MLTSNIPVKCPNCTVTVRCPFIPYDLSGDFVPREWIVDCPNCGYPIKVDTKEIEARLEG